jgi:flagellar hook protein FlgE
MMDVVANDLANVNTVGYKSNRFNFRDSFSQILRSAGGAGAGLGSSNAQQVGLGTDIGGIDAIMSQGSIQSTGSPLDVAIQGDGMFTLTDTPGTWTNLNYTRAGNFSLDVNGNLTTIDGYYVVGLQVNPGPPPSPTATNTLLNIPTTARTVNIDQNGLVSYVDAAGVSTNVGYLALAKFANTQGLQRQANNRWGETVSSGPATIGAANTNGIGLVSNRALEMSNVDMANQFSDMIRAQRGYQANSRVITTVDDMLQALVSMKR